MPVRLAGLAVAVECSADGAAAVVAAVADSVAAAVVCH